MIILCEKSGCRMVRWTRFNLMLNHSSGCKIQVTNNNNTGVLENKRTLVCTLSHSSGKYCTVDMKVLLTMGEATCSLFKHQYFRTDVLLGAGTVIRCITCAADAKSTLLFRMEPFLSQVSRVECTKEPLYMNCELHRLYNGLPLINGSVLSQDGKWTNDSSRMYKCIF